MFFSEPGDKTHYRITLNEDKGSIFEIDKDFHFQEILVRDYEQ